MPISVRAQAVLQHERSHALLIQPRRIVLPFMWREAAISPARTDYDCGASRLRCVREVRRNRGDVLILIAESTRRTVRPKWKRIFDFRSQQIRERERGKEDGKKFHVN